MAHPQRERLAVVIAGDGYAQGSGYLLSPWLVLTAAHVVAGASVVRVAVPGSPVGLLECRVIWTRLDDHGDAALLGVESPLVAPAAAGRFERLNWGVLDGLAAREGATAIGFPDVQRTPDQRLDTEQLLGTLKPGTGLLGSRPVLDSAHQPPLPRTPGVSPWAGMSGAPVFLDNCLVGVVRSVPLGWGQGRLELTLVQQPLRDGGFLDVLRESGVPFPEVRLRPPADSFEKRLLDFLAREWEKVRIYGVTRGSLGDGAWQLGIAYLSLELGDRSASPVLEGDEAAPSRRVEDALSGRRRILLRGTAGSGKTTLLQWLTTAAARGELPEQLGQFRGCVPVLLRLRALARPGQQLPGPEEFLRAVGNPLAGAPGSAGWMSGRMAEGRVLLLVDGIDEAPESERRRVRDWLSGLLAAYPEVPCVVTTRPAAVGEGWLADLDFSELELLPMSRADVVTFIDRWHRAALGHATAHPSGSPEAHAEEQRREQLESWRQQLTEAVGRKQDLGRLATNPLMCSLICVLNADRRGHLPSSRMALYDAALENLLVRRDEERGVDPASEGVHLSSTQQQTLLQKLAYWLIRNGQSELSEGQALSRIEKALPAMPRIEADAPRVLRQLLVRSGLLREPVPGAVDFVHRTFQDYLGAQEAVEEGDMPLLVAHAHEDQWEDVFRMAVGHARRRERAELLTAVLRRAEAEPEHRDRLRLLAAACLELAVELDPAVAEEVTHAAAQLVPPRDRGAALALALAGPVVLDLLPGPEGLDDATAHAVVVCAANTLSERAIPLLAAYARHPYLDVRAQLAYSWAHFETEEYGREVISRLDHADSLRLMIETQQQLDYTVRELGPVERVELSGDFTADDIRRLPLATLRELRLHENRNDVDLSVVREAAALEQLMLINCPGEMDLAPLVGLPIERVIILGCPRVPSLAPLATFPRLRHLSFANGVMNPMGNNLELTQVLRAPLLDSLRLSATDLSEEEWELLCADERITSLDLDSLALRVLESLAPLPHVRLLRIRMPRFPQVLPHLPRVFPGAESVWLYGLDGSDVPPGLFRPGLLLGVDGDAPPPGTEPIARPELNWASQLTWYRVV